MNLDGDATAALGPRQGFTQAWMDSDVLRDLNHQKDWRSGLWLQLPEHLPGMRNCPCAVASHQAAARHGLIRPHDSRRKMTLGALPHPPDPVSNADLLRVSRLAEPRSYLSLQLPGNLGSVAWSFLAWIFWEDTGERGRHGSQPHPQSWTLENLLHPLPYVVCSFIS